MRNTINIKPDKDIFGRNLYSAKFVEDIDIKEKNILDIGCGYGWFELYAVDVECKKIIGIEISSKDLVTAKNSINNSNVDFIVADALKLPFDDGVFDTVVSWEVLEHLPKDTEIVFFKEVRRVLKDNGVFYFSTPNNTLLAKIGDPAWWLQGHRHYKVSSLSEIIKKSGLSVERLEIRGGIWEIIGMLNLYIAKWGFKRDMFLKNKFKILQNEEFKKHGFTNIFMRLRKGA
jgi:SAM-dependent methyltransferase